jgi:hypothetical protein
MPVTSKPRSSSRTSLPGCAPLVPGQKISLASTGQWRNVRSTFAETDLQVQEVILEEERVCGLYPFDRQDLSAKLEDIRACVDGLKGECV